MFESWRGPLVSILAASSGIELSRYLDLDAERESSTTKISDYSNGISLRIPGGIERLGNGLTGLGYRS